MKSGYCTIMWNRRACGANEMNHHQPKAGFHPKKVKLCICWDWKGVLCYELLPEKELIINSNKYWSQLDQLKPAFVERHPELVNRKHIIFHQDNANHKFL